MTDDVKDTGVRTDRASVEVRVVDIGEDGTVVLEPSVETLHSKTIFPRGILSAGQSFTVDGGTLNAALAERDAAIARAEKAEGEINTQLLDALHEARALAELLAESQSQADALRADVRVLREAIEPLRRAFEAYVMTCEVADDWQEILAEATAALASTDTGNGGLKPKEGV